MTSRVGANGRVVIPEALLERANLQAGAEVDFALDGARGIILTARRPMGSLGGRFASSPGMASRLLEDRGRESR